MGAQNSIFTLARPSVSESQSAAKPLQAGISWLIVDLRSGRIIDGQNHEKLFGPPRSVGSLMKVLAACRAVDTGSWDPGTVEFCRPWKKGGKCWNPNGHGVIDLVQALSVSCNDYFLRLESALDPEETIVWYASMGVTGLSTKESDDPSEKGSGGSRRGSLIGHADDALAIPVSVLMATAALLNGGWTFRPDPEIPCRLKPLGRVRPDPRALEAVRRGMAACSLSGTGSSILEPEFGILGKTGTSIRKIIGPGTRKKSATDGWFMGFWTDRGILLLSENEKGSVAARRALEIISCRIERRNR